MLFPVQSTEALSSQMAALESEKAELVQSMSKVEAELEAQREELQRAQSSLATERESGVKAAEALQNQLNEKVRHSPDRQKALEEDSFSKRPRLCLMEKVHVHRKAGSRRWRASWWRLAGQACEAPWRRQRRSSRTPCLR